VLGGDQWLWAICTPTLRWSWVRLSYAAGGETRTDPISTGSRFSTNDRELRWIQMSRANPLWGPPRIHGELLKLGISVSQATVAKYRVRMSAVAILANLSRQSHLATGFSRLVHRTNSLVRASIRLGRSASPIRVGLLVESAKSLKFSFGCKKCRVSLLWGLAVLESPPYSFTSHRPVAKKLGRPDYRFHYFDLQDSILLSSLFGRF
jgi:hypothetical protein